MNAPVQDAFAAVHNANNIAQMDAAISQGIGKPIGEGVQALGDMLVGAFDKGMTAAQGKLGDALAKAGEGTGRLVNTMEAGLTPGNGKSSAPPAQGQEPAKDLSPDISQNKEVTSQVSTAGLKWPPGVVEQQPVHVAENNLAAVTQSALVAPTALSQTQTQSQGLGA